MIPVGLICQQLLMQFLLFLDLTCASPQDKTDHAQSGQLQAMLLPFINQCILDTWQSKNNSFDFIVPVMSHTYSF